MAPVVSGDSGFAGEDADHLGAALDLAIEGFQRADAVLLCSMLGGWRKGWYVGFGVIHRDSKYWQVWFERVSDVVQLRSSLLGIVLGEGGAMKVGATRLPLRPACGSTLGMK